jgi:hypothetical protein
MVDEVGEARPQILVQVDEDRTFALSSWLGLPAIGRRESGIGMSRKGGIRARTRLRRHDL